MRHGRLIAAIACLATSGLAAAQHATLSRPVPAGPAGPPAIIRLSSAELPPAPKTDAKDPPKAAPKEAPKLTPKDAPAKAAPKDTPAPADPTSPKFAEDTCPPDPAPTAILPQGTLPQTVLTDPGVVVDGGMPAAGPRFWFTGEYLAWRIKKDQVPPLVGTGPAQFPVGFLSNPATATLYRGDIDQGTLSGVRAGVGCWLDDCQTVGIQATGFWLPAHSRPTTFYSAAFPVLTRPFSDVNPGGANAQFLAFPGIANGDITIDPKTELYGATVAGRYPVCVGCNGRLDALVGAQGLDLHESITITESPVFLPTAPFPGLAGAQFIGRDRFETRNKFYGGVVGFDAQLWAGKCSVGLTGSLGVGRNQQTIDISGSQTAIAPGGNVTVFQGGLLAIPGNIGRYNRNQFSLVPQAGVNVGLQVSCNCQLTVGYSLLCWTNVVRPGAQIDPVLDVNRIPNFGGAPPATAIRPQVPFEQQTFWAQGITAGIRLSW